VVGEDWGEGLFLLVGQRKDMGIVGKMDCRGGQKSPFIYRINGKGKGLDLSSEREPTLDEKGGAITFSIKLEERHFAMENLRGKYYY